MVRTSLFTATILLALTAPAAASCVAVPDGGAKAYPQGQGALLLCQQRALSDVVDTTALDEQLRAMELQLQRLRHEQQRQLMRPLPPFDLPRF